MKKILIPILLLAAVLGGCSVQKKEPKAINYNSNNLRQLVLNAVNGDSAADKKLNQLIDYSLPINNKFNQLEIDSLLTPHGSKLYTVLLSFPNPIYNRFAIYNKNLQLILLDKSLNGYIAENILKTANKNFVKINEQFLTKDVLQIERVSLYGVNDSSAALVFRAFTKLQEPKITFTQKIDEITEDRIKTSLGSSKYSKLRNKADIFEFNDNLKRYVSSTNIFRNFIKQRIERFKRKPEKPELVNRKSALLSVGINPDSSTALKENNNNSGYSISLSNNWHKLKDIDITKYLKKKVTGTKYINNLIGSQISIVMIPPQKSAENYIKYKLTHTSSGKYLVRYSNKISLRKDYLQFFEYSCSSEKYLLILTTSKYTYKKYKSLYENIVNSFLIEC